MKKIAIITSSLLLATSSLLGFNNGDTITVANCGNASGSSCVTETYTYQSSGDLSVISGVYSGNGPIFTVTVSGETHYFGYVAGDDKPCKIGKSSSVTKYSCTALDEAFFTGLGIDYGQDSTPPTTSASSVTDIMATTATFKATINEAGNGYYIIVADGSTTPTSTQVKAGSSYSEVTIVKSGNSAMSANTEKSFSITGLSGDTAYDLYFVAQDSKPNLQTSATQKDIQTQVPDTTPDSFSFTAKTEQDVSTSVTADESVTVADINIATDISIVNGEYKIGSGSWTSTAGTGAVNLGDTVQVRTTTSVNYGDANVTTLTIGTFSAEFNTTTKYAEITSLTANNWNLVSIGNGKLADLSTMATSQYSGNIWMYKDNNWTTDINSTSITPKDGFWVYPTSTKITFKAQGSTSSNLSDANAQYSYYKDLNSTAWHLVGVPNSLEWSNVVRSNNITPNACTLYSGFYIYNSSSNSWNTTSNISANSGAWLKHNCPSVATISSSDSNTSN